MRNKAAAADPDDEPIRAEIILYQSEGANVPVEVRYMDETLWLTQAQMAGLFDVDRTVVGRHLKNIFESGELIRESTCAKIAHVWAHGSIDVDETLLFSEALGLRVVIEPDDARGASSEAFC